jgi:hypothetical protein
MARLKIELVKLIKLKADGLLIFHSRKMLPKLSSTAGVLKVFAGLPLNEI